VDSPTKLLPVRLTHAVIGIQGECGELASALEKWIYYGQSLDIVNIKEELGDMLWYISLACNSTGLTLDDVMESNLRKLQSRYPEKYVGHLAIEENRDREAERRELERNA
jgi:NTP pyrophosphatase (non-canonical NTP hydrolase)